MAFRSFQDFVEQLDRAGELRHITEEVDTDLSSRNGQIANEIAQRWKTLLFEKPIIDGKTRPFLLP